MSRCLPLARQPVAHTSSFLSPVGPETHLTTQLQYHFFEHTPLHQPDNSIIGSLNTSMDETAATPHSAMSGESTGDNNAPEIRVCEDFSNPAGNIVVKSSDNVIFRVEDFYLKANR